MTALAEGGGALQSLMLADIDFKEVEEEEGGGELWLARALSKCTLLTAIRLVKVRLGNVGTLALAPSLAFLKELKILKLSHCDISDAGMLTLATSLKENCSQLQSLSLDSNSLGDPSAFALADCCAGLPCLILLDVFNNQIGDSGIDALAKAMPLCPELKFVNLAFNPFSDLSMASLVQAVPHCKSLCSVSTTGSRASPSVAAIVEALVNGPRHSKAVA